MSLFDDAQRKVLVSATLPTRIPLAANKGAKEDANVKGGCMFKNTRNRGSPKGRLWACCGPRPRANDSANTNAAQNSSASADNQDSHSPHVVVTDDHDDLSTSVNAKKYTKRQQPPQKRTSGDGSCCGDDDDMLDYKDFCDVPLYEDDELTGRNAPCELACAPLILNNTNIYIGTTTRAQISMFPTLAQQQVFVLMQTVPASAVSCETAFRCAGHEFLPQRIEAYIPSRGEAFDGRYSLGCEHADCIERHDAQRDILHTVNIPPPWHGRLKGGIHNHRVCVTSAYNFESACVSLADKNTAPPTLVVVGGFTQVFLNLIDQHRAWVRSTLLDHKVPQTMQALVHLALARVFDAHNLSIMATCQKYPICIAPVQLSDIETALRACLLTRTLDRWRWRFRRDEAVLCRAPYATVNDCTTYLHRYLTPFYPTSTGAADVLTAKKIVVTEQPLHNIFNPAEFRNAECRNITIFSFGGDWDDCAHYHLGIPSDVSRHVAEEAAVFRRETEGAIVGLVRRCVPHGFLAHRNWRDGGMTKTQSTDARRRASVAMNAWAWRRAAVESPPPQSPCSDVTVITLKTRPPRNPHAYFSFLPRWTRDYSALRPYIFV